MWVSIKEWANMRCEIAELKSRISDLEKGVDKRLEEMAKRILREPEQLSKELRSKEQINEFIEDFLHPAESRCDYVSGRKIQHSKHKNGDEEIRILVD